MKRTIALIFHSPYGSVFRNVLVW